MNKVTKFFISVVTILTSATSAFSNSAADIDDEISTVESLGKIIGGAAVCNASPAIQQKISTSVINSFVATYGSGGRAEFARAVERGRKRAIRDAEDEPQKNCTMVLFAAGSAWEEISFSHAVLSHNPNLVPARILDRQPSVTDLTAAIGRNIHPALNICASIEDSEALKAGVTAQQKQHIWGLDESKYPKKEDRMNIFLTDDWIYTGSKYGQDPIKSKCKDALILAGAFSKLLIISNDTDTTANSRWVLRRILGMK